MFERFTDKARRVVVLAQEESRILNHNYIGTEHLLLGLIREGEGVAAQVLQRLGAELSKVRQQVVELLSGLTGSVGTSVLGSQPQMTPEPVTQGETASSPLCPRCRGPLEETVAYGVLDVRTPEGEEGRPVQFVYCRRCGTWLGTIPPSDLRWQAGSK